MSGDQEYDLERQRIANQAKSTDNWVSIARTAIRCSTWLGVAWFLYRSVAVLAGTSTAFSAAVHALVDLKADQGMAYVLAGGFGIGYFRERKLRQRTIKEQAVHIRHLEEAKDPGRSSSGLLLTGEPRKEDRDAL
jgi:hypothetical protein